MFTKITTLRYNSSYGPTTAEKIIFAASAIIIDMFNPKKIFKKSSWNEEPHLHHIYKIRIQKETLDTAKKNNAKKS
jgi:hypothetical protein